ncbi:MAG: hypothetical protein ABL860_03910 [Candidatus Nitrotoga sp.]
MGVSQKLGTAMSMGIMIMLIPTSGTCYWVRQYLPGKVIR